MWGGRRLLWPVYVLAGLTVLDAAFTLLPYAETAAIKIGVPPQRLEAKVVLNGGGAANLAVQHLEVGFTDAAQGTATGAVAVSPQFASGWVEFMLNCTTIYPACQPFTVPAGTVVATTGGARYTTQSTATLRPPGPSGFAQLRIRAIVAGAAGNTGRDTIKVIELRVPSNLTVSNVYAVSGGADGGVRQVIQQSDVDVVQAALAAKATYELGTALMAKAGGMTYVIDGLPALDFASDRAVGDEAQTFTLSVTGKQSAKAIFDNVAKAILRDALRPLVLPGYELAAETIRATYQFVQSADSPEIAISAAVVGYALPKLSKPTVSDQLKGMSISDAHSRLRRDFPGSSIDIRTKPVALPWLPFVGGNISLTMLVDPAI